MKRVFIILATLSIIVLLAAVLMGCPGVPAVMTKDATDITSDSATLHGSISNISENDSITVHFRWKQYQGENEFGIEDHFFTPSITMISNTAFSSVITGLTPNTTYMFQAECVSAIESTLDGEILTFTTSPEVLGEQEEEEEEEEEPTGEQEEEDEEDEEDEGDGDDDEEDEYYSLLVSSSEGGSVTSPAVDLHTVGAGETVILVAEADEGYQFDRWDGGVDDPTSASTTITMNEDKSVTAYFSPIPPFELRSTAFDDNGPIPDQCGYFTQDGGQNTSPSLYWTGVPADTVSFVLIMEDRSWGCIHWVVFNIPADTTSLEEGASSNLPAGAVLGSTDAGIGYYGCNPDCGEFAAYHFTIYALDTMLTLPRGANKAQVIAAIGDHILGEAILVGIYEGPPDD